MDEQDDRRPGEQAPESAGPPPAPAPEATSAPPPAGPPPSRPLADERPRPATPEPAAIPTIGPFDPPAAPVDAPVDWPQATTPPPAPRRTAAPTAPRSRPVDAVVDDFADDLAGGDGHDDEEFDEPSRWVTLLSTVGLAIIGIVTVQVVASLVQGLTTKSGNRLQGVSDDFLHRLGYPFDSLGSTALLFLVLGIVLLALPAALDEYLPANQDRLAGIGLRVAIGVAVIVAIGSVLAVRATLHLYSASNSAVPTGERIRFTTFLLGALGAAALVIYAALAALSQRARERWDD